MTTTGKLTQTQRNILEEWIGTGQKKFTLLYSIVRDGCDPHMFHMKCNNVGPTVTVLYTPQGSVYGGYTAAKWGSCYGNIADKHAFMYQLAVPTGLQANKFPCTNPAKAIFTAQSYGPAFGEDWNLLTFSKAIPKTGFCFSLNMSTKAWGKSYFTGGQTFTDVSNGTNDVIELEVYLVKKNLEALEETEGASATQEEMSWRNTPDLNEKLLIQMKEEIENFAPMVDAGISEFRILLVGPVGSGKSSFFNTIDSVFRGRVSHRAICSSGKQSTTTAYTPYQIRTRDGSTLKFRLCDTSGLDETLGPTLIDLMYLVDGHVPDNFESKTPLTTKSPDFVTKPSPEQCIHTVAIVLDASNVDSVAEEIVERINELRAHLHQQRIPYGVVLTNIDKVDKELKANPTNVFTSTVVEEEVETVSKVYGVPMNTIFPVKNYHYEVHLNDEVNMLALMALQQLLYMAEDYAENVLARLQALNAHGGCDVTSSPKKSGRETADSDTA